MKMFNPTPMPRTHRWRTRLAGSFKVFTMLFLLMFFNVHGFAQSIVNLDQAANNDYMNATSPMTWQNGNLNEQQSHYIEGHSVPYRAIMKNLPAGKKVTVTFGFDLVNSNKYALDFITGYQWLKPHTYVNHQIPETVDPTLNSGTPFSGDPASVKTINAADYLTTYTGLSDIVGTHAHNALLSFQDIQADGNKAGKIGLWGGSFTNDLITYTYKQNNSVINNVELLNLANGETKVEWTVSFIADGGDAIIAFGGHIARRQDWGDGNSAGGLTGSPYHSREISWVVDGKAATLGNADRSLKVALSEPTCPPALCTSENCSNVCVGTTQTFAVPSTSMATTYTWSFESNNAGASFVGGTPPTTSATASVTPTQAGSYTVKVILGNGSGFQTTCTYTVTVTAPPTVTCPQNVTENACQTQEAINTKFAAWLATFASSGGTVTRSPENPTAPAACGGTTSVTWSVTNFCGTRTCTATFTVTDAPAVNVSAPANNTQNACQTQTAVNTAFTTWLNSFSATGGCGLSVTRSPETPTAPAACGGTTSVTWTVNSTCATQQVITRTFTVTDAPAVSVTPAQDKTEGSCQTQTAINTKFTTWLNSFSATGGCGLTVTTSPATPTAPNACGGSTSVTWTVRSACASTQTYSATFTVTDAPAVTVGSPSNTTEASCQTQTAINTKFAAWLAQFTSSGGCGRVATMSPASPVAPNACGGTISVTYTVTSNCATQQVITRTFTVTDAPAVNVSAPANNTQNACQTQTAVNTAFTTWLNSFSATGGCGLSVTRSPETPTAPAACGGTTSVTWTVNGLCGSQTITRTFTVTDAPAVNVSAPANNTQNACQTQTAVNTAFTTWLNSFSATGGCGLSVTRSPETPTAPAACGGTTSVTWTVNSTCATQQVITRTFTVTDAPAVTVGSPSNTTEASCQTQTAINTKFAAWLAQFTSSGGCGRVATMSPASPVAPNACGGTISVTYTVTSTCATTEPVTRTFTVTDAPAVNVTPAQDKTEGSCQTQTAINTKFTTWLNSFSATGGCGLTVTTSPATPTAPNACGGSTSVTWTVRSACASTQTYSATFTVTDAPAVNVSAPANNTQNACQTQTAVNTAFTTWLNSFSATGGCGLRVTTSPATPTAPAACGGTTSVTWNVTSGCTTTTPITRTFTVTNAPAVNVSAPANNTQNACQTQTAVNTAFTTWLNSFSATGGCGLRVTTSPATPTAPAACGGTTSVTWTVNSTCATQQVITRTFTVTDAPAVTVGSPSNTTEASCQTQTAINTKFAAWLAQFTSSGGCGRVATMSPASPVAPNACGGTISVTYTVTSTCATTEPVTRTFTVTADNTKPVLSNTPQALVILNCDEAIPAPASVTASDCSNDLTSAIQYTEDVASADCGGTGFKQIITRTWTVSDICGNSQSFTQTIKIKCCETLCTYTQGYFGNPGGKSCAGETSALFSTKDLIKNAVNSTRGTDAAWTGVDGGTNWNGKLKVGTPTRYITISTSTPLVNGYAADVDSVVAYLPGGGASAIFTHNGGLNISSSDFQSKYTTQTGGGKKASRKIKNTLLNQTITLGINLGIKNNLASLALRTDMNLVTWPVQCGTHTVIGSDKDTMSFDPDVVGWLGSTKTVKGLFDLAGKLLANEFPTPAGYTDQQVRDKVASVVDQINNAFDGCRDYEWMNIPEPVVTDGMQLRTQPTATSGDVSIVNQLSVSAYPNPFTDVVKFTIASPISGQAQLEVYNMMGQKVNVVYNGFIEANKAQVVEYHAGTAAQQNLIYMLNIGGQRVTGKLLNVRK